MSGQWTIGSVFVLRHAGFPFDWLEELGWSSAFEQLVAALLDAEEALIASTATEAGPKALARLRQDVQCGREPVPPAGVTGWAERIASWRAARRAVEERYPAELAELRARLHRRAADETIQEAVFLSNPAVYANVWERYLGRALQPLNAERRRVERVVYTYLQRLCAKNETTSFFGPMGYGEIVPEDGFEVRVERTQPRRTMLSYWAVCALANVINREQELFTALPVARNPLFTIDGDHARSPAVNASVPLSPLALDMLALVASPPRELAELAAALRQPLAEVTRAARQLIKAGILVHGLHIPSDLFDTLGYLTTQVAALPDGTAADRWRQRLSTLRDLLAAFADAAFADRRRLLPTIETHFTEYTGLPARRGAGQVYADRLVLYEEAGSRFRIQLGGRQAAALAAAVAPTLELATAYGEQLQRGYRRKMVEVLGPQAQPLNFLAYAMRVRPEGTLKSEFAPVTPLLIEDTGRRQALAADICGTAHPSGRYALPDVCLLAASPAAIRAGDVSVVVSRVHHHLLVPSWLSLFYEYPERFAQVARSWLEREPSANGIVGLELTRRNKGFYAFPGPRSTLPGVYVAAADAASAADLTVALGADGPTLQAADGGERLIYLALSDYATYPPFAALAHPLVIHPRFTSATGHVGRLTLADVVVQRERWECRLEHLSSLHGLELALAITRERQAQGWPRFVFARVASERKPYMVDTASPFGHELLRYLAAQNQSMLLEEMLPGPEDLWLHDAQGRYTCELRMQITRWSDLVNAPDSGVLPT